MIRGERLRLPLLLRRNFRGARIRFLRASRPCIPQQQPCEQSQTNEPNRRHEYVIYNPNRSSDEIPWVVARVHGCRLLCCGARDCDHEDAAGLARLPCLFRGNGRSIWAHPRPRLARGACTARTACRGVRARRGLSGAACDSAGWGGQRHGALRLGRAGPDARIQPVSGRSLGPGDVRRRIRPKRGRCRASVHALRIHRARSCSSASSSACTTPRAR